MLDFFRNHKRLMMCILVLILVPGLGFVGIQGFRGFFDDSVNVASVNGHKISRAEFDNAMRQQIEQARQIFGAQFDAKTFDTPERRRQMLDDLIQQRVMADETRREYLTASDDAVRRALLADPVIASLRKPDGTIDVDRYKQLLAMQGMTPEQYDEQVRYGLSMQQIPDSIESSAFTSKNTAEHLAWLAESQRAVQSLMFKPSDYTQKVQPTDAQLLAYYDAHRSEFITPETASIQYLVLSPETLAATIQLTSADEKHYYDDNIAHYTTPREVRVSQILITAPKNASAADVAQAQARAKRVLAEVNAHPEKFAQIAQKESEDPSSASKGGDLGYSMQGVLTGDKAFDSAALKLNKDQLSGLVRSAFGYHIIKVTAVKPAVIKPFDAVKEMLIQDLRLQLAKKAFDDDADGFTSMVYEKAKSLQPAADKYKLKIQTATLTPKPNPTLAPDSPLNNAKFLAAVFADDAVKASNNTQAIDVGGSILISARVTHYQPAATLSFDTVKGDIRPKVIAEQAAALARQAGIAKLADLQKSKSTVGFSPEIKVSRINTQGMMPAALSAIFKADAQTLPTYVGVDLGTVGYAIYRVNALTAGPPLDAARLASMQQQITQVIAQAEMQAYLSALQARSKVKRYNTGNLSQGGEE